MKKKSIVENDKAKIEQVIAELDEKKNEALKKAFERVNIVSNHAIAASRLFKAGLAPWGRLYKKVIKVNYS
jgi:chromosome segregation ATPase